MRKINGFELVDFLSENVSLGCKALERPFVFVLKSARGAYVVYQCDKRQKPFYVGTPLFPSETMIDGIFDIELKKGQHIIGLIVRKVDKTGIDAPEYFIIGDKKSKADPEEVITAFFAYEAVPNRSINSVSIIEEIGEKSIFNNATRYGKSSAKMLKMQLNMYLALIGVDSHIRRQIVSSGILLETGAEEERSEPLLMVN